MYTEKRGSPLSEYGGCDRRSEAFSDRSTGDFVTLTSVDNEAKTVVISDKELGEIKHMPKQIAKSEPEALEEEINETDYDDEPEVKKHRKKSDKPEKKKKEADMG